MHPRVSVILPYYEGRRWLRQTVESVCRQTEPAWELIIVDDGSSEGPGAALQELDDARVRFIRISHSGKGAALNRGVECARAGVVCFIDQDDLMLPSRLAVQLNRLEREPGADGVYSDYERRHADGRLIDQVIGRQVTAEEGLHLMGIGQGLVTMQTLMLRKSFFNELGGFSPRGELTGLDDLEFFVRVFLAGQRLVYEPAVVQVWVLHQHNFSNSLRFQDARLEVLARLTEIARTSSMLAREMRHYRFHAHGMRGLYFLEAGNARSAVRDLAEALRLRPTSLNSAYLLIKALVLTAAASFRVSAHSGG